MNGRYQPFGQKLSELMKGKGMALADLARELNTSYQAVHKYVAGTTFPRAERLHKIADLFGVSSESLIETVPEYREQLKADGKVYRPRRADAVINQPRLLSVNTALLDALISLLFALPNPTEEQISTAKTAVSSALKELA